VRIEEALALYCAQLEANGRSLHTIRKAQRHIGELARWAARERAGEDLRDWTSATTSEFLRAAHALPGASGAKRAQSTLNGLRSSVRSFFRFLVDAQYIAHDPARLVKHARCASLPPRGLSAKDQERLIAHLRDSARQSATAERDQMLVALALATGLRLGSLLGLDVQDMDLDAGELIVRVVKGGTPQIVPLGPAIVGTLKRYIERLGLEDGPLFRSRTGERLGPRQVQQRLRAAGKRAGLRRLPSPHDLRRTFGIELYARTHDLLLVQAALGHAAITSTLRYAAADQQRLRNALQSL